MKKNKRAFTLIELLAVIVVLAVIALIATPVIIGVIEKARKKAFEDTAYGVLEGLKLDYVERTANGTTSKIVEFSFPNNDLKLSGEEPAGGTAIIDENGKISFTVFDEDKRWCAKKYINKEKIIVSNYTEINCRTNKILDGTAVYFDPIKGEKCNTYNEENSLNENKIGCMKFYTFGGNNGSDNVNLLLDHNTTYKISWKTIDNNTNSKEIFVKLKEDTKGWIGNPRLITADEVAAITGNKKFKGATSTSDSWFYLDTNTQKEAINMGPGTSKYKWLFDYTSGCTNWGCDNDVNDTAGFWTSTIVYSSASYAWLVSDFARLRNNNIYGYAYGIRPVITILKSKIL